MGLWNTSLKPQLEQKVNYESKSMQQTISTTVRQNPTTRKAGLHNKNIRAKTTGVTQIFADNSFLKEQFKPLSLAETISFGGVGGVAASQENMKNLIKAATGYLKLYEKEFSFIPSGNFSHDMENLIDEFSKQLPENQELNVDYSGSKFVFIIYQSNKDFYWSTICYIPLSIAHTMRPKVKRLYVRFCAFMKQANNINSICNTYDYQMIVEDIKSQIDEGEEVDDEFVQMYHSYEKKTGKANKLIKAVENHTHINPNDLLHDLKKLKGLTPLETEQVNCMIRGTELMSRDNFTNYVYNNLYDEFTDSELECGDGTIEWQNFITFSWGDIDIDPIVRYHFNMLNDSWQNMVTIEPFSFTILSPDKQEKLQPCNFPFKWLEYLEDYYKHLVNNEQINT